MITKVRWFYFLTVRTFNKYCSRVNKIKHILAILPEKDDLSHLRNINFLKIASEWFLTLLEVDK